MLRMGIIGAMSSEVENLIARMEETTFTEYAGRRFAVGKLAGKDVVVVQSGIGKVAAAITAQMLVDRFGVTALLNTGMAGGLDGRLAVKDLVVATGALQHEGLTWQVLGSSFVRSAGQSRGSRQLDRSLHALLQEMDLPCRRQLIDDVFSVGTELGVETLAEMVAEGRRAQSFRAVSSKLTGIDRETRDCFLRALKSVFREEEPPADDI